MGARVRPSDGAGAATDAQEGAALLRNWSRHHCRFALVRVRARVSACVRACVARGCSCTGRLEEMSLSACMTLVSHMAPACQHHPFF